MFYVFRKYILNLFFCNFPQTLTSLEQMLINCSKHLPALATFTWGRGSEVYYEKEMVSKNKILYIAN